MKRSRDLIILLLFKIFESLWSICAFAALSVHASCSLPAYVHVCTDICAAIHREIMLKRR